MKVCVGVSASGLTHPGSLYASLSYGDNEFGQTEEIEDSTNPTWKKIFILDCGDAEEGNVAVSIRSKIDDTEVGRAQFGVAKIMAHKNSVVHEELQDGGVIFLFASDHITDEFTFKLQLSGKDLANLDGAGIGGLFKDKSDPFYEVQNSTGDVVYKSEVIENDLNPEWAMAEIDLQSLCESDFDAPIELTCFDRDLGKRRELIGSFQSTVNDLVVAAAYDKSLVLFVDEKEMGTILVLRAECDVFESVAKTLNAAAKDKEILDVERRVFASKSKALEKKQKKLEEVRQYAAARNRSLVVTSATLTEARRAADEAKSASLTAAEQLDELRESGLRGSLKFQFIGKELKNVELFTNFDKSDPFFVIQKQDGDNVWSHVFISNVVQNNLNPEWDVSEVAVADICSHNLDDPFRVVVFDHNESGKHKLIGHFETSISSVISTQISGEAIVVTDGKDETGHIGVPYAEVVGFVDPDEAEDNAKKLKAKADTARYYAIGAEHRAKLAKKNAEEAQNTVQALERDLHTFEVENEIARMNALKRTVSTRLQELALGS
uniref:C2 domain-containing protein n=1 Tax=Pseudictyota dubia TaxID=2749911 RepID=A0A7R9VD07_9STRA|mmetsp:Transcript_11242/g.21430  ORF Transcript_11242/g.21430 Transcript_11242/m.21430 type:complete len:549 (+) Transcript_11242:124-1770(+)|eukprot:CAMPEP_0197452172 /NCGR_PEP_ID=MMETSP1175-20131217/31342_1 /TAXON_ID=1003142 /ORGANISM="Triceratium dubium, Strain CCMP147" /LENGTH=548 /DNA_ID=CAMNT_0042985115 /DNA_START=124 /DNA_END=1770 /DNA_ORIENTATION=-